MHKRIFAERLAEVMEQTGATQLQVAAAANVTQSTVSRWLEGTMPKADDLWRVSMHFNRGMDWFLGGDSRESELTHSDPIPEKPTLGQFYSMAEIAQSNANTLRVGAERFGRLQEMVPRIESLEREAAALKALVEEMVAASYTPGTAPPNPDRNAASARAGIPADILEGVEAELAEKAGQMSKPRKRGKR